METILAEIEVGDPLRCGRRKHGADVDGHVEQTEGRVTLVGILGCIVKVAHQHLQIAFK